MPPTRTLLNEPADRHHYPHSFQLGRTSAARVPHFAHTNFGPNEGTVTSPGRWSTFMITSCRQPRHCTARDRTPFWRILARSIGTIGSVQWGLAIGTRYPSPFGKGGTMATPGPSGATLWARGLRWRMRPSALPIRNHRTHLLRLPCTARSRVGPYRTRTDPPARGALANGPRQGTRR
jgi:hypothetical protein